MVIYIFFKKSFQKFFKTRSSCFEEFEIFARRNSSTVVQELFIPFSKALSYSTGFIRAIVDDPTYYDSLITWIYGKIMIVLSKHDVYIFCTHAYKK